MLCVRHLDGIYKYFYIKYLKNCAITTEIFHFVKGNDMKELYLEASMKFYE